MKINIGAGIQFRSGLARDVYAAGGVRPEFVGDFTGGVYRVDSTASTFADAFTFARTGTATFVDSDGVLQTAATGVPRTAHHLWDGSAWVNAGLLLESEARTNLVPASNDWGNVSFWSTARATLTANQATSPDGTTNAASFVEDGTAASTHLGLSSSNITVVDSVIYTSSVFLKANTRSWVQIQEGQGVTAGAYFNISNGTIGTVSGTGSPSASIEDFGNGWYRCSLTFTAVGTAARVRLFLATGDLGAVYDGDGVSGVFVWGAQLEAGSTPSSYIPTTGTTATRNAETLTIAAADAPWPEPVVIGPELVTNGTFDTDSDWTKGTGWTISGGVASSSDGSASSLSQTLLTTTNNVYAVTFTISNGSGSWYLGIRLGDSTNQTFFTTEGTKTVYLVDKGDHVLRFADAATGSFDIDNISVREINPLAVSIQMEGTVTYADTDSPIEASFYERDAGSNVFLKSRLSGTLGTGALVFEQHTGSVYDNVVSDGSLYSPGINVPFNIASRHGSTFVNGAVDGTALTANTTPTALPDLSATDVDIGPTFMGTIGRIVIWADDIGNAGIAAASA